MRRRIVVSWTSQEGIKREERLPKDMGKEHVKVTKR